MNQRSTDVEIALLIAGQKALQEKLDYAEERAEKEIAAVNAKLNAMQAERDSALKWGVSTLGLAVAGMATWIFQKITGAH
jgi:hypothetical protein